MLPRNGTKVAGISIVYDIVTTDKRYEVRTIEVTGFSSLDGHPIGQVTRGSDGKGDSIVTRRLSPAERNAYSYALSKNMDLVWLKQVPADYRPTNAPKKTTYEVSRGVYAQHSTRRVPALHVVS